MPACSTVRIHNFARGHAAELFAGKRGADLSIAIVIGTVAANPAAAPRNMPIAITVSKIHSVEWLVHQFVTKGAPDNAAAEHPQIFCYPGRVVVITGGSRGLGLLMARQLNKEGARLALLARNRDELMRAQGTARAAAAACSRSRATWRAHACATGDRDRRCSTSAASTC